MRYNYQSSRYILEKYARLIALELDRKIPKLQNLIDVGQLKNIVERFQDKYPEIIGFDIHGPRSAEDNTLVHKASTNPDLVGKPCDLEDVQAVEKDEHIVLSVKQAEGEPYAGTSVIYVTVPIHTSEKLWPVIVTRPYAEIMGPINEHARNTYGLLGLLFLFCGGGMATIYKVRKRKAVLEAEKENLRRIAEAGVALQESELKHRNLIQNIPGMTYRAYSDWSTDIINGVEQICGYTAEEINSLAENWLSVVHPDDKERVYKEGSILLKRPTTIVQIYRIMDNEGNVRWIEDCKTSLFREGEFEGIDGIAFDITERKLMEEELLKVEKLESVGVLAGGIAHDLNNLLTGVVGSISLARLYDDPADKDRRLAEAEEASMGIKNLTQQLLTFSKGGVPVLQTADMAGLLVDSATFTLRGSNVGCEFSISDDLWPAEIDAGQMNQVINNLVINSQHAMPRGGVIKICAENVTINAKHGLALKPGAYIKVSVADQGIGIPEGKIQKIFDPFFTTKRTGNGLGLATSYSIIQKHNGHITVESQVGVGTTFYIYLPASPGEIIVTEKKEEKELVTGEGKMLVMDDEKHIRDLAAEMLSNIGYEVTTSIDGAETIEIYETAMGSGYPFDAVIIDLTIPGGMGGKETIQRLTKIDPAVKAIVSSGYSNDPVMANFAEYGFKGVVAKPYKARELSEVLHKVITEIAL